MSLSGTLDHVIDDAKKAVAALVTEPVADGLHSARKPVLRFVLSLFFIAVGSLFVAIGAALLLAELRLPPWATCLGVGLLMAGGGLLLFRAKPS